MIINNEFRRTLPTGSSFGELALLYGAPRSAAIKTVGKCELWGIDRTTFKKVVQEITEKVFEENRKYIENIDFFNKMSVGQKEAIAGVMISEKYTKGKDIVCEGDSASSYYIIKKVLISPSHCLMRATNSNRVR